MGIPGTDLRLLAGQRHVALLSRQLVQRAQTKIVFSIQGSLAGLVHPTIQANTKRSAFLTFRITNLVCRF